MMPSVMGMPADSVVLQCSNYGSTGGTYPNGVNGLRSQFSDTVVPSNEITGDDFLTQIQTVMTGTNSVVLRPLTDEEQAEQNLWGISFLPWNQRPYDRTTWGTNSQDGTVYAFNPWNKQTMMTNGLTLVKVGAIGLVTFYVGKFVVKKMAKRA